MDFIKKKIIDNLENLGITAISVLLILFLNYLGLFHTLELKIYDYCFSLRGPTSGWMAREDLLGNDPDIVIVDLLTELPECVAAV